MQYQLFTDLISMFDTASSQRKQNKNNNYDAI